MTTQTGLSTGLAHRANVLRRINLQTIAGAVTLVLVLRMLFGVLALPISAQFPQTPLEEQLALAPWGAPPGAWLQRVLIEPWMRYDANWYATIVEHGYRPGEGTAAFHPLYPLLVWPLARLSGNMGLALLLTSTLATVAACVVFAWYVAAIHDERLAQTSAWLLLLAPPSFIMLAPYNEALFLALAIGSLWAMQRKRWWLAGLLGGLAALTRQQGLALALPMAWALYKGLKTTGARIKDADHTDSAASSAFSLQPSAFSWLSLGLIPLSYALFVAYRAVTLGDLAVLAQAQSPADLLRRLLVSSSSEQVLIGQRIDWPWVASLAQLERILTRPGAYDLAIDLALGWAMVLVILAGLRHMTAVERLYALAIVALTLCYYNGDRSPMLSMPRHIMLAFPLYIVLARWAGIGTRRRVIIEVLIVANLFLCGAYIRNGWIP
jgi:hypothetical protein